MNNPIKKALAAKKKAEVKLQSVGRSLRKLPTSAGTGTYRSLTVGETADKLVRGVKKVLKRKPAR